MTRALILTTFLICFCDLFAQQNDTILSVMRSTRINNGKRIVLQGSIDGIRDVSMKAGKDHYNLKKGSFKGADSVDIEVNGENKIVAISFLYDTSYQYEKDNYTNFFKTEYVESSIEGANLEMKVTRWQDSQTIFELVEITRGQKTFAYSTIFDKSFFYRKHQSALDKEKKGDSYEILRKLGRL